MASRLLTNTSAQTFFIYYNKKDISTEICTCLEDFLMFLSSPEKADHLFYKIVMSHN
jgi:hypothetical protein